MKIKLMQVLTISYLILVFILSKKLILLPLLFFATIALIDILSNIRIGIKNLLYLSAALSAFPNLLGLFLLYLPFAVFGCLLAKKGFLRNYIFGFAISFIPTTSLYLLSTYFSLNLNLPIMAGVFFLLPLTAVILMRKKSLDFFELSDKESMAIVIILSFTTIVAIGLLGEKELFMANGVREFSRLQYSVEGLSNGEFVTYNPAIAQGEATFLWNTPAFYAHISLSTFMLGNAKPILFFNFYTFFILLLSIISLSILLGSIINREESILDIFGLAIISSAVGLNFFFLQLLESFKQYYSFPIAYLFLSMILENPKSLREFVNLAYLSIIIVLIHLPYGAGVNVLGACLFILVKSYYVKDRTEIRHFLRWSLENKLKILIFLAVILLPLFYITPSLIYKDFFAELPKQQNSIAKDTFNFFKEFFQRDIKLLSVRYPDVNRIDDHKAGFLLSVFGSASLIMLVVLYKIKNIRNYRIFLFAYILNLIILSLITARLSLRIGGFYRTVPPYLLVLMGASIIVFILVFNKKIIKSVLIALVLLGFLHTIPFAKQNLSNIHKELFASGEIYSSEINFIRQLADGRIMTYGLFSNAIDFGGAYLTDRYFSRNERIELAIDRTIFEKIHGQHSFGQDDLILPKSGAELYNYLRLGGYKYVFLDARHYIGNNVISKIYPNFSRAIYQNGPLVIFEVNSTNYAEKVELVKDANEEIYKEPKGYRYITVSKHYNFDVSNIDFKDIPKEPEPLSFERLSPTKVKILGNFNDDNWVVFKEQYFPRWKAYINGKEAKVYASNHDLILIRTVKGDNILLEYSVLNAEKTIGSFSLLGFLSLAIFFLLMAKQNSGNKELH